MKNLSALLLAFLFVHCTDYAFGQKIKLHRETFIEFASPEQGKKALAQKDVFVNAMSRFDRQSRMQVDANPSVDEYLAFVQQHVVAWKTDQITKLTSAIESAAARMERFAIPFPSKILLVTTDGKEEGGAAYCRGPTIVLPQNMVSNMGTRGLERLLIHELFHVLSNQNPKLRQKLYAVIGFKPCGEIDPPTELIDRKLTNPDGPTLDYFVEIQVDDRSVTVIPFLFAKSDFDAKKGGSFFQYLQFKLMEIEKKGKGWSPKLKAGLPIFYAPDETPSYFEKIGRNTDYIIHPDEVLADNFVYLLQKKTKLKTPRIVEELAVLLQK